MGEAMAKVNGRSINKLKQQRFERMIDSRYENVADVAARKRMEDLRHERLNIRSKLGIKKGSLLLSENGEMLPIRSTFADGTILLENYEEVDLIERENTIVVQNDN